MLPAADKYCYAKIAAPVPFPSLYFDMMHETLGESMDEALRYLAFGGVSPDEIYQHHCKLESNNTIYAYAYANEPPPDQSQQVQNVLQYALKRWPCPFKMCEKRFTRKYNLRAHLAVHDEFRPRPFACQVCSKAFLRSFDLQRHANVHTKAVQYECPGCNKRYTRTDALQRHLRKSCSMWDSCNK